MAPASPTIVRTVPFKRMAIVHDWFQGYGGGERVAETMRADFRAGEGPADILTFHAARDLLPPELAGAIVRDSRVARLPGVRQRGHRPGRWRNLLPYMPTYFRHLDLSPYDLVVASSWACAMHARPPEAATYVCYCHTPMRYVWLPELEGSRVTRAHGAALRASARRLRRLDRAAARRPNSFVANSNAVRERIERFYGREAAVIPPPVEVDDFEPAAGAEERFLWVQRLTAYKRPELVAEAFRGLPFKLTMVGIGPLEARLRASLPTNVELRGWLEREELAELYASAAGFVHVAEEDFGITMVEALASGTPVLALDRGGARDIVRDGVDGVLVDRPEVEAIRAGVRRLAERAWDPAALAERAREFSRDRFVERFGSHLDAVAPRG